jgi:hypothetical protein
MNVSILIVGIVCVIASIIGGGLKAFGIEIPIFQSVRRQVILLVFGAALIGADLVAKSIADDEIQNPKPSFQDQNSKDTSQSSIEDDAESPILTKAQNLLVWREPTERLMWPKDATKRVTTLDDAVNYCMDSTLAGYKNWRVPSDYEFDSLVQSGATVLSQIRKQSLMRMAVQYG